jgi:hemerythrin-like domain-containing protein
MAPSENHSGEPESDRYKLPSAADLPNLARTFAMFLDQQQRICNELEAIADSLPDAIDDHASLDTAQRLLPLISRAHEFEEKILFPMIVKNPNPVPALAPMVGTIERLQFEHWGDEDFAADIYHAIRAYVAGHDRGSAEALGWMLRGFFESMRRHIAFEREYILPFTRDHLQES